MRGSCRRRACLLEVFDERIAQLHGVIILYAVSLFFS
jgi:hypothetical protein